MPSQKRCNRVSVLLTDQELTSLEHFESVYSMSGSAACKSSVIRYALNRLPHQPVPLCI